MTNDENLNAISQGIFTYIKKNVKKNDQKKILRYIEDRLRTPKRIAEVTTAIEMTTEEKNKVERFLNKEFGKEISVQFFVNPKILGGIKIKVGDILIDRSFSGTIDKLSDHLLGS